MVQQGSRSVFDGLMGQPQVRRFLESAIAEGRLSHAYLFVGPIGTGKADTATALAQARLCPDRGGDDCDTCRRIAHRTHPDVHWIEPEGVAGYLIEQVKELIHDVSLAPIRAQEKVYIITRADLLRGSAANAFLKTLEEPPARTSFILMSRSREAVLETVLSRCQTLIFRRIPDEELINIVARNTGASESAARRALTVTGGSTRQAIEFLKSSARAAVRLKTIDILEHLAQADALDTLDAAKELTVALKAPLDDVRTAQADERAAGEDYLSKGALKALEKRHKRELSLRERAGLLEALAVVRSWLRDCITVRTAPGQPLLNDDVASLIEVRARTMELDHILRALALVDTAESRILYNVTVQLVIEAMLFDMREVLYAHSDSGQIPL
jgi:DNA polymerase III subunit delta'